MIFFRPKYGRDVLKTYCVHISNYFLVRKLRIANVHDVVRSHCRTENKNRVQLRISDTMDVRPEQHLWGGGTFHLTSTLVNILI